MSVTLRSFAKINLGLAIGATRPDGYHALATVYQTVAAHDLVTVTARRGGENRISLTCNDLRVPTDGRNTAWKMVEHAVAAVGFAVDVAVDIDKRLPVQGGLGAGSANAAAALLGLERELGITLSPDERMRIAAEVGSDVPLFLVGGTVMGLGRGEQVFPLPDLLAAEHGAGDVGPRLLPDVGLSGGLGASEPGLGGIPCVVAVPEVGVSTPEAFREWDARHVTLTATGAADRLERLSRSVSVAWSQPHSSGVSWASASKEAKTQRGDLAETPLLALVRTGIANDFEEVVFRQHPSLADILRVLRGSDLDDPAGDAALYAALSGSGSALFGLYRTPRAADRAVLRLRERGVVALRTETLPRQEYWRTMWEDA
jgi:4-diphosphocytidyl-2-C-methyl-D-erythritol kinase